MGKNPSVPVLTYHRVGRPLSSGDRVSMDEKRFRSQMVWLKRLGFKTLSLKDLYSFIKGEFFPSSRSVVITFDDGYRDILHNALPVMGEFGFKGAIFAVPGMKESRWDERESPTVFPLMGASELKLLLEKGWDVGSHGLHHRNLKVLSDTELFEEIYRSKEILEEMLGISIDFFSYPYGQVSRRVSLEVKRAGYKAAFTTRKGRVYRGDDPYFLKRITVGRHASSFRFLKHLVLRR